MLVMARGLSLPCSIHLGAKQQKTKQVQMTENVSYT